MAQYLLSCCFLQINGSDWSRYHGRSSRIHGMYLCIMLLFTCLLSLMAFIILMPCNKYHTLRWFFYWRPLQCLAVWPCRRLLKTGFIGCPNYLETVRVPVPSIFW